MSIKRINEHVGPTDMRIANFDFHNRVEFIQACAAADWSTKVGRALTPDGIRLVAVRLEGKDWCMTTGAARTLADVLEEMINSARLDDDELEGVAAFVTAIRETASLADAGAPL